MPASTTESLGELQGGSFIPLNFHCHICKMGIKPLWMVEGNGMGCLRTC